MCDAICGQRGELLTCHEYVDKCKEIMGSLGRLPPNVMWNICVKLGMDARENATDLVGFSTLLRQVFPCPCTFTLAVVETEKIDPQSTSMYRVSWDFASKAILFGGPGRR